MLSGSLFEKKKIMLTNIFSLSHVVSIIRLPFFVKWPKFNLLLSKVLNLDMSKSLVQSYSFLPHAYSISMTYYVYYIKSIYVNVQSGIDHST